MMRRRRCDRSPSPEKDKEKVDDTTHREQKRITLLNAADRLLTTVLGPINNVSAAQPPTESPLPPPASLQSISNVNGGPRYLIGISTSNLMHKEQSIYECFCNLNNCFFELKRQKKYYLRDLGNNLLGKEAEKAIRFIFQDLTDIDNPARCISDSPTKYLEMKNMLHAFSKLMRDMYCHLGDVLSLGLAPYNTMQYLLDTSKPFAELIPKCLRFIHYFMMSDHAYWFGRYFTSLMPLFLPAQETIAPDQKVIINLFLRNDVDNMAVHENDDVEYIRLKFDRGLMSLENLLALISHDMNIRLFSIQGLSGKKKFAIRSVDDLSDDLVILVKPNHQEIEEFIKTKLNEFYSLQTEMPQYEHAIMKMEECGLFDNEKYPDSVALRDIVLFFVDKFKFGLRLLQASENAKAQWISVIQKCYDANSKDGLITLSEFFVKETVVDDSALTDENRLSPTIVTDSSQ
jgi:hypothetical protein